MKRKKMMKKSMFNFFLMIRIPVNESLQPLITLRVEEKVQEEAENKANLVSDTEFTILENRVHTMENSIGEIVSRVGQK